MGHDVTLSWPIEANCRANCRVMGCICARQKAPEEDHNYFNCSLLVRLQLFNFK